MKVDIVTIAAKGSLDQCVDAAERIKKCRIYYPWDLTKGIVHPLIPNDDYL